MKFCKWIIEKNNHFIELNRTSFLILWHWRAIWYIYNGYFKNIVSYLFLAGCILIFLFKISNLTQINKVINFLKNSPLNIVIGSLWTEKNHLSSIRIKTTKKEEISHCINLSITRNPKIKFRAYRIIRLWLPGIARQDLTSMRWNQFIFRRNWLRKK
ncbi:hypothetical protein [Spiroplasma endosymbiont of Agriotes lineatus]|uniref:hypothetical protein n=1 Tax=Spiroplasma endosymbiont of Agriotes lineatus TaxID=3077930 RepID=UPI0030D5FE29